MKTKELKIQIPEGYEIDKLNSTPNYIKLKPIKKDITYGDICERIFDDNGFYISEVGGIKEAASLFYNDDKNNATNRKQLKRLLALNQLLNIAEYYNRLHTKNAHQYVIVYNKDTQTYTLCIGPFLYMHGIEALFNTEEDAQAVIDNPNFREILDTIYK